MIDKAYSCDECAHASVCGIRKDRERLICEMERLSQRPEFAGFRLHCICDSWLEGKANA
jgi:hypothetical protein